MQLTGIHHLTAITADAPANKRFYTNTLGLRLVKKTVNQDDTSAYHLFYADGEATPGTDLTFFDWPIAAERRGTHSISRTGLRVSGEETLSYWAARFKDLDVNAEAIKTVDGRATLDFEDPEGQRFRLVDDGGSGGTHPWGRSPVPAEHQIRGLGPITISVPKAGPDRGRADASAEYERGAQVRLAGWPGQRSRLSHGRWRAGGRASRRRPAGFAGFASGRRCRPPRRIPHA